MSVTQPLGIAVDIGATYIRLGLGNRKGRFLVKVKERTPQEGDEYTIANYIIKLIDEFVPYRYLKRVKGIGVGSIGPLNLKEGRIVNTPNIKIKNSFIVGPIREYFNIPTYLLNDCVAGVWGEKHYGAGKGVRNLVYITISTGIGGGVVVDDHLLLGKDGNAHEIGHIVIDYRSRLKCGCGGYGHWEGYASGANIPNFIRLVIKRKRLKIGSEWLDINAKEFFMKVREGDYIALKVFKELCRVYAAGVASVINVYDPELVTIGGSVFLNNYDLLYRPIVKYTKKYLINRMPKIIKTSLGDDVVLYGALATVFFTPESLLSYLGKK